MLNLFASITKLDDEKRLAFGYASTEALDSQGEIVRREALEAALPDYMRFANIREMHLPSAVGVAHEAEIDDKGLLLAAKIVDNGAWQKVKERVYKGFSIGGRVTARDPADRRIITGVDLTEISLVDRPANPEATIEIFKRADGALRPLPLRKWDCGLAAHQHAREGEAAQCIERQLAARGQPALAKIGARNSREDLARIQAIHDQSVDLGACCPRAASGCDGEGDGGGDDGAGKKVGIRDLAKLRAERDEAFGVLTKLGQQLEPLAGEVRNLKKRLAVIEAQPLPAKGVLGPFAAGPSPLGKEDDRAGSLAAGLPARLAALPAGQARADEILRQAYFAADARR